MILQNNGKDFEPIPTGLHRAVCVNFFDLGYQPGYQGKPPKHECAVLWELDARKQDGSPFTITKRYTASLYKEATLGKHLVSWRTRAFTEDEEKGFDTESLIGINCQLNIIEKKSSEKTRAEVDAVLPPPKNAEGKYDWKGMVPETPRDYMPEWVKNCIEAQLEPPVHGDQPAQAPKGDDFTDDIPF